MDQHVAVPKPFVGPTLRVGVLLAVAILAAFGAWIVLERGRTGETSAPPAAPADGPRIMTADGLTALAGLQGSSVYWAGPRPDVVYEVTKTTKGYVFVRYLPGGTSPGDPRPDFLTVASAPVNVTLSLDSYGNLYIADTFNHHIRKISTNGIISTVAGSRAGMRGDEGP